MYYLIYRSQTTNPMPEEDLNNLLGQARDRNRSLNITGMLLFFDNKFLQLLEGEERDVKLVYDSIRTDTRHKDLHILKEGPAEKRLFPGWSMSFRLVSHQDFANEQAYKDIYKPGTAGALDLVSLFNLLRGKTASRK